MESSARKGVVDVPQILFLIGFIHVFRVVFFHWLIVLLHR